MDDEVANLPVQELNKLLRNVPWEEAARGNLSIDDERHDDDVRYLRRIGSSKQCVV